MKLLPQPLLHLDLLRCLLRSLGRCLPLHRYLRISQHQQLLQPSLLSRYHQLHRYLRISQHQQLLQPSLLSRYHQLHLGQRIRPPQHKPPRPPQRKPHSPHHQYRTAWRHQLRTSPASGSARTVNIYSGTGTKRPWCLTSPCPFPTQMGSSLLRVSLGRSLP
jgi:hypothetical protein